MAISFLFLFNSLSMGVGLSMDAFSVSLVNGMNEPALSRWKICRIAGVYAFFQALMPMLGWLCAHTVVKLFTAFEACIPWISLGLLTFIGVNMISESKADPDSEEPGQVLTLQTLLLQGIATSIDALSVGFAIAGYSFGPALVCSAIIASVTFLICTAGVQLGRRVGDRMAGKASFLGGVILICVGLEILLVHIL